MEEDVKCFVQVLAIFYFRPDMPFFLGGGGVGIGLLRGTKFRIIV